MSFKKRPVATASLLVALLVLGAAGANAQAGSNSYGFKIYRVESGLYPYVHVYLRTFDGTMRPLPNLNTLNVGVMVKGRSYALEKRQYDIRPIRQRPEAVRSIIVLDASKTMAGKPFDDARRAAARFIDSKRPQDQVALLAIRETSEGYEVVSGFERDPRALGRRLADVVPDGNKTRLYDTVGAAMQMAAAAGTSSPEPGAQDYAASTSILVLSDGKDEGSALSREELNGRISSLPLPIPVYSVAYSKISKESFKNLEALSKNSFGAYHEAPETARMQEIVEGIQDILLGDYVVVFRSYVPVDGEQHAFKVGLEYPTGSRRYTYEGGHFEAIQPPPVGPVQAQLAELSAAMPPLGDGDPYMEPVAAAPAAE